MKRQTHTHTSASTYISQNKRKSTKTTTENFKAIDGHHLGKK